MTSSKLADPSGVAVHRSADSHEIRALTGIRGVAAFWVVAYHFFPHWLQVLPFLSVVDLPVSRGHFGVDLFFMLSGFILSYVYASGNLKFGLGEYGKFIWYRVARVFPNFLVALFCMVLLQTFSRLLHLNVNEHGPYSHLIFQVTLTQIWPFVPPNQTMEWVGAAWTLSAEWFAYIFIFPILAYVHRQRWGLVACVVMSYLMLVLACYETFVLSFLPLQWILLLAICEFFAGGFIFAAYLHSPKFTSFCRKYVSFFSLLFIGLVGFVSFPDRLQELLTIFLMPLILVGLTDDSSWAGWLLSTPLAVWSGRISYALYITHVVTMHILKVILPWTHFVHSSLGVRLSVVLAQIAVIITIAVLLHYGVEIPARNYLRKKRPW